ncbi:MAG: DUF2254 domain-containing protein [Rhizobiaceae bacterium]|nr:DUF2254 domain-containing protein [Rhizobiaceae bacterium]
MPLNLLRYPFVMLLTLPALIALSIAALSPIVVTVEQSISFADKTPFILRFEADSARGILSVVAAAAITALSLTYSLVLVVFTLAAGNIGPRLLKRFSSDPINQFTAGLFGGTFLYALVTLIFVQTEFVPRITIAGAVLLAILCVFQLIFFVRHVSQSVTIDDEIAKITQQLGSALADHLRKLEEVNDLPDTDCPHELNAGTAGYVGAVNEAALVALAAQHDLTLRLEKPPGQFVLGDEVLLVMSGTVDDEVADEIRSLIDIDHARSQTRPIEFSIHLLVEIALRALSPGVNDAYTAIAAIDSLSSAFATIADENLRPLSILDEDDTARLIMPELSVKSLVGQAFHPLRRAAADNLLVAQSLARALARLQAVGGAAMEDIIEKHAALMVRELERAGHLDHDIGSVTEYLPEKYRSTARSPRQED